MCACNVRVYTHAHIKCCNLSNRSTCCRLDGQNIGSHLLKQANVNSIHEGEWFYMFFCRSWQPSHFDKFKTTLLERGVVWMSLVSVQPSLLSKLALQKPKSEQHNKSQHTTKTNKFTIGNKIVTVHKLFWRNYFWIAVPVLAPPRMSYCYNYSTGWNSQRTHKSP